MPLLEVSMAGLEPLVLQDALLGLQAAREAGDLERCIAWAWLVKKGGSRA